MSEPRHAFTVEDARRVGDEIGIDWASAPFDVDQFRIGMNVELEHGLHDPPTNVSDDDPHVFSKIALAHLNEFPRLLHAAGATGGRSQAGLGAAPSRRGGRPGGRKAGTTSETARNE